MEPTHINPSISNFSNIDLTFANKALAQRLDSTILHYCTKSYHFLIVIQLVLRSNYNNPNQERWNLKHPNYISVLETLKHVIVLVNYCEIKNIKDIIKIITGIITFITNITIRKSKVKNQKYQILWWNQEIKQVIMNKNYTLKKFLKIKFHEDFIHLKPLKAKSFHNNINEINDRKAV